MVKLGAVEEAALRRAWRPILLEEHMALCFLFLFRATGLTAGPSLRYCYEVEWGHAWKVLSKYLPQGGLMIGSFPSTGDRQGVRSGSF